MTVRETVNSIRSELKKYNLPQGFKYHRAREMYEWLFPTDDITWIRVNEDGIFVKFADKTRVDEICFIASPEALADLLGNYVFI